MICIRAVEAMLNDCVGALMAGMLGKEIRCKKIKYHPVDEEIELMGLQVDDATIS